MGLDNIISYSLQCYVGVVVVRRTFFDISHIQIA